MIPGRVPTDPRRLAAALDAAYPPATDQAAARAFLTHARIRPTTGPARRVSAVAELVQWHQTNYEARQAILRVLADVPGLLSHGWYLDGTFAGIAVSIVTGPITVVLAFAADTGQLGVGEQVLTDPVIGRRLGVQVPYSISRSVLGWQRLTDQPTMIRPARKVPIPQIITGSPATDGQPR